MMSNSTKNEKDPRHSIDRHKSSQFFCECFKYGDRHSSDVLDEREIVDIGDGSIEKLLLKFPISLFPLEQTIDL